MKIKTSELQGAALDWAVAKCEGLPLRLDPMGFRKDAPTSIQAGWWVWDGEENQVIGHRKTRRGDEDGYSPSTDWSQGGPIIQREKIGVWWATHYVDEDGVEYGNHWYAEMGCTDENVDSRYCGVADGPTPLIAAMRCYVTSKLGDEIEVPDELQGE